MSFHNSNRSTPEVTALPNGVRIATESMPHVRSVSVGVWVDSGSRHETPQQNGISHFIEHMLFKGTCRRSAADIAREMDSLGGNLDAFTSKEQVCYSAKVLDEHLARAFDILADLTLHPRFDPEDIEKEKGVILEELKMEQDSPEYLVHEMFASTFWKGHSLGRPILGTRKSLRSFEQSAVAAFYKQQYNPRQILLTAAGNIAHQQFCRLVEAEFGQLAPPPCLPPDSLPVTRAGIKRRSKRSLEQVQIALGLPCHEMAHPKRHAGYLLNVLLGGGLSSRLFQNIREDRGLAYAIYSEISPYRDTGALSVFAGTSIETTREVIRLIVQEFRRLRDELVTEEELRRAKDHLKGSFLLGMESTSNRMASLARHIIYFGRPVPASEILESVEAVSRQELRDVACETFHGGRACLALLGNLNGFTLEPDALDF